MGWRFSRRVKILPGITVNFGKKGTSVSLGGKGARVTYGAKGKRTTFGLPGTGISYTNYEKYNEKKQPQDKILGATELTPSFWYTGRGVFVIIVIAVLGLTILSAILKN